MSTSGKSSPKPSNVFYVWYSELCRRKNLTPLTCVKPARLTNGTVLDFVGDRIKVEEWKPILTALHQDRSLHVIAIRSRITGSKFCFDSNTEEKLRSLKKNVGCLFTEFIMQGLTSSLCNCIQKSEVLSTLEIDGLPLYPNYFCRILEAIRRNRTLKVLSFKRCQIKDVGCEQICLCLHYLPNIEVLILSDCELSAVSGQHISKIIKYQQTNRYCETWHSSLRYTDPSIEKVAGLKRVTINNNPSLGNEGLSFILEVLADDLWIKALDVQNCNITEEISHNIFEILNYNKTLEILDLRRNDLSYDTMNRILEDLQGRMHCEGEYNWCLTSTTLAGNELTCIPSSTILLEKSQSVPSRSFNNTIKSSTACLKKTRTTTELQKSIESTHPPVSSVNTSVRQITEIQKQISVLNSRLKQEIQKRIEAEKANQVLKNKLERIQKLYSSKAREKLKNSKKLAKHVKFVESLGMSYDEDDIETLSNINKILKDKGLNLKSLLLELIKDDTMGKCNSIKHDIFRNKEDNKCAPTNKMTNGKRTKKIANERIRVTCTSSTPELILEKFLDDTSSELDESDKEDDILYQYYAGEDKTESFRIDDLEKKTDLGSSVSIQKFLNNFDDILPTSPAPSLSSEDSTRTVVDKSSLMRSLFQEVAIKVK